MNNESKNFSWKGFVAIIIILVIVSIIAYVLASIEGSLTATENLDEIGHLLED